MLETNTLKSLDVGLADELKRAVIRAGGTAADLKALTMNDEFAKLLPIIRKGEIPVWIKGLGVGGAASSKKSLLGFAKRFFKIDVITEEIVYHKNFYISTRNATYDLALVSGYDLGFSEFQESVFASDIFREATKKGLSLCPPDLAFYLRASYSNQRKRILFIAIEPIRLYGRNFIFHLENLHGKVLFARCVDAPCSPSDQWIFVKP